MRGHALSFTFTFTLTAAVAAAAGCNAAVEDDSGLSKEQVRQRAGKADDGHDYCELYGWYGDGVCDVFCTSPDPDCGVEYCYGDDDCEPGLRCNAAEVCLSPCPAGSVCPAVCAGFCVPDPAEQCGGLAGLACDEGEFCDHAPGATCGAADQLGTCKPRPEVCLEIYQPVCGCDDRTYGNECEAHAAGVAVARPGECDAPAPAPSCEGSCGGQAPGASCYCDAMCSTYGDCCADYEAVCADPDRTPASGVCVRNSNDECTTDADCATGGCGGELCFNPALGGGFSTCDCTAPTGLGGCGCVAGKCTWYE